MAIIPENLVDQITWFESHAPVWAGVASQIGISVGDASAFANATKTARNAFDQTQLDRAAAKASTVRMRSAVSDARSQAADLLKTIKAYAENQPDPALTFAAAQIPMPTPPAPLAAPGKPNNFNVTLNSDGSVTLSWDATASSASSGVFFTISRKLPGQGAFAPIGGTAGTTTENRRAFFTDATVPASAAANGAQYIVQGFRGTRAGEQSDAVIVQFGVGGDGAMNVSIASTSPNVKLAA